jgi:hypothetical protein
VTISFLTNSFTNQIGLDFYIWRPTEATGIGGALGVNGGSFELPGLGIVLYNLSG